MNNLKDYLAYISFWTFLVTWILTLGYCVIVDVNMIFKENDAVRILCSKDENIKQGDIGVVVMVFDNPNIAYEIEVIDVNMIFKENYI